VIDISSLKTNLLFKQLDSLRLLIQVGRVNYCLWWSYIEVRCRLVIEVASKIKNEFWTPISDSLIFLSVSWQNAELYFCSQL
jgi:hypothetical protein